MADLKSGTPLYFVAENLYPYWEPIPEAYVMDKVFENVLEAEAYSWGHGDDTTGKWRWKKKYADDADEAHINPSTKGSSAGAFLGVVETDSEGTVWLKVNFPFTFYNRDGDNHDTNTTIWAWVKSDEVAMKKDSTQTLKDLESTLGLTKSNVTASGVGSMTGLATNKIVIILAAILILGLLIFVIVRKKPDPNALKGQPVAAQPTVSLIQIPKSKFNK